MSLIEKLPIEIFYKVMGFLDIKDLKNLIFLSKTFYERVLKCKISLIFVNNKQKINYFFNYNFEYLLKNKTRILNKLESICNNDFIEVEFDTKVYINYLNQLDIIGILVYNYYIYYIQGKDFYVLPKFKDLDKLILEDHMYYPEYVTYTEKDIQLKKKLQRYITPNKKYKNIKFNYYKKDLFHSNLIS